MNTLRTCSYGLANLCLIEARYTKSFIGIGPIRKSHVMKTYEMASGYAKLSGDKKIQMIISNDLLEL